MSLRPELNEGLLSQLALATKMEKGRVISWAAAMRRRMGVASILKEPSTLELDEEEEEVVDEVKKSGISPLDYFAAFAGKPHMEEEDEGNFEHIVDETEDDISDDYTENSTKDASNAVNKDIPSAEEGPLVVNDDSEMDIDVVNIESLDREAAQKPDDHLMVSKLARQGYSEGCDQLKASETQLSRPAEYLDPSSELGDPKIEPKVEAADVGEISIVEKASRYDHMSKQLEEMKSKYDSLFKLLVPIKSEPQTVQQPWAWNPHHQQKDHSRVGPYNPYQPNPTSYYSQSLPYPPPDQGSIYPSYNNSFYSNPNQGLPYPPPDHGSIYPNPTFQPSYQAVPTTLPYPIYPTFPPVFQPNARNDFFSQKPSATPWPLVTPTMQTPQNPIPMPNQAQNPTKMFDHVQTLSQEGRPKSPKTAPHLAEDETLQPEVKATLHLEAQANSFGEKETMEELKPTKETDEMPETGIESEEVKSFEDDGQTEKSTETEVAATIAGSELSERGLEAKETDAKTGDSVASSESENSDKNVQAMDIVENSHLQSELYAEEEKMVANAIVLFDTTVRLDDTIILLDDTITPTDKTGTVSDIPIASSDKSDVNVDISKSEKIGEAQNSKIEEVETEKDDLAGAVVVYTGAERDLLEDALDQDLDDSHFESEEAQLRTEDEDIENFIELHKEGGNQMMDTFSSWQNSSSIVNSTTNYEAESNHATDSKHTVTINTELKFVQQPFDNVDEKADEEVDDDDFFETDEVEEEMSPEERVRQELFTMEKELQDAKVRAKAEEEERKRKFAELKQRKEEFRMSEKKRMEREKMAREEEARVKAEMRRKELEALRLQEVEVKRERKLREMEEQKALREQIMRKKVEEETARQEEMRRREEEKRGREEEKAERETARRSALEKSGKQSRRDMQRSLSKRPQYPQEEEEEEESVSTSKRARYRGGEEDWVERSKEASWKPNHQTKRPQQKTERPGNLMGFNMEMYEEEEEDEEEEEEVLESSYNCNFCCMITEKFIHVMVLASVVDLASSVIVFLMCSFLFFTNP